MEVVESIREFFGLDLWDDLSGITEEMLREARLERARERRAEAGAEGTLSLGPFRS